MLALVAVGPEIRRAFLLRHRWSDAAEIVAAIGLLDLDHVRAHVRQDHRTKRAGDEMTEIRDADAGERQACAFRSRFRRREPCCCLGHDFLPCDRGAGASEGHYSMAVDTLRLPDPLPVGFCSRIAIGFAASPAFPFRLTAGPDKTRRMSVEIVTFGCRLNTYESEVMRGLARDAEDTVIVNTCAVTAEAERQARQTIRRLAREQPGRRIVVTGCAVQIDPSRVVRSARRPPRTGQRREAAGRELDQ